MDHIDAVVSLISKETEKNLKKDNKIANNYMNSTRNLKQINGKHNKLNNDIVKLKNEFFYDYKLETDQH